MVEIIFSHEYADNLRSYLRSMWYTYQLLFLHFPLKQLKANFLIFRDALIVACVNSGTSFFAGFVVFSVTGYMAVKQNTSVSQVAKAEQGLAFLVYPSAISQMSGSQIWGALFFLMIFFVGLDSQVKHKDIFNLAQSRWAVYVDDFWMRTVTGRLGSNFCTFQETKLMIIQMLKVNWNPYILNTSIFYNRLTSRIIQKLSKEAEMIMFANRVVLKGNGHLKFQRSIFG